MGKKTDLKRKIQKAAPLLILLAGCLWGTMGIFVRHLNALGIEAINIVAIRSFVTVICLFPVLLFYDKKLLKVRLKDIWCFIGTGCCSIVFFNFCYFTTIETTSMSVAAVLLYTAPAIVMVLSRILFQEIITGQKLLSLVMAFVGCAFVTGIVGNAAAISQMGIITGLGAGLGYALYSIFGRYALEQGYQSLTILFYTFLFASIGVLPLADLDVIAAGVFTSQTEVMFAVVFGIVSTILPYFTYTIGLRYVENSKASIMASIEPVVATVLGILLFEEKMTVGSLVGIILVLLSVAVCNLKQQIKAQKPL